MGPVSSSARMEEYQIVLDNTAKLSDRRQTTNDLFVGLNSFFLTALGFLFVQGKISNFWMPGIFVTVSIITTFINIIWLRLNLRYRDLVGLRVAYLEAIEEALQKENELAPVTLQASFNGKPHTFTVMGVHRLEAQSPLFAPGKPNAKHHGFSSLERQFIRMFIYTYIFLAVGVLALSLGVHFGLIADPGFIVSH